MPTGGECWEYYETLMSLCGCHNPFSYNWITTLMMMIIITITTIIIILVVIMMMILQPFSTLIIISELVVP
jgi:hypothetical protein